ncbi:MAG: hypothetical protein QXD43_02160 [Candidatus Aenigmatarchaeota archaeon]
MLGQIRIEFVIGIVIFVLVIFFIVTQTNILFSSLLLDSRTDTLKAKASNAIKALVEDKGDPPNWNETDISNIKRIGLAEEPYKLSKSKILNLSYNCSNSDVYKNLLWNFDLKAYRLKIYNSTHEILFCGFNSLEPPAVIEVRYVYIDNDFGKITLELW